MAKTNLAILCVDDEATVLRVLREQLRRLFGPQYVYEVALSAADAWPIIEELEQDGIEILMVVSDWLMPNVKGDEFLAQVHQRFPKARTVMLTGQTNEGAIAYARENANLYAFLAKPWQEEELIKLVNLALNE